MEIFMESDDALLTQFLQDWDHALVRARVMALDARNEFRLGPRDASRRYPRRQDIGPDATRLEPRQRKVVVIPDEPKPVKRTPTAAERRLGPGAVPKGKKRGRVETSDPNPQATKTNRTESTVDVSRTFHSNNAIETDRDPRSLVMENLHCLYSLLYLLVRPVPDRLLVRYVRSRRLTVYADEAKWPLSQLQRHYALLLDDILPKETGPDDPDLPRLTGDLIHAIRTVHGEGKYPGTPVHRLFEALLPKVNSYTGLDKRIDDVRQWVDEYLDDPYLGHGLPPSQVWTWPNLIKEDTHDAIAALLDQYFAYVFDISPGVYSEREVQLPNGDFKLDADKKHRMYIFRDTTELSQRTDAWELFNWANFRIAQDMVLPPGEKLNILGLDPLKAEKALDVDPNVMTALVAQIVARLLDKQRVSKALTDPLSPNEIFDLMPIEFTTQFLLENPRFAQTDSHEAFFKAVLERRLGRQRNDVYGPLRDRVDRILERIQTVYYLNPADLWARWAEVRAGRGYGPYEYQWATIIPLLAAELAETNAQGELRAMLMGALRGAYVSADPGVGKTLMALALIVLGNLITGNKNPTLIVIPPTVVDEWTGTWLKFFAPTVHSTFPLFVYERFEAKPFFKKVDVPVNYEDTTAKGEKTYIKKLPANAIVLVKRGQMEKFSNRKYHGLIAGKPSSISLITTHLRLVKSNNGVIDLRKEEWQRVFIDEAHMFHNRETFSFEGAYDIIETRQTRPFVYLLSGTPVVYNVIDLTTQLRLLGFKLEWRPDFTGENRIELDKKIAESMLQDRPPPGGDAMDQRRAGLMRYELPESDDEEAPARVRPPPLYDQVGAFLNQLDPKARAGVRNLIHQIEFEILFREMDANTFELNKDKLFGHFYQLFVDDTPQYQRLDAPSELIRQGFSFDMTSSGLETIERCLLDMIYPFMGVPNSRDKNWGTHTSLHTPLALDNIGRDFPPLGAQPMTDMADELFARQVVYEQWKNQFVHTTIVDRFSLAPPSTLYTFAMSRDKGPPQPRRRAMILTDIVDEEAEIEEEQRRADEGQEHDSDDEAIDPAPKGISRKDVRVPPDQRAANAARVATIYRASLKGAPMSTAFADPEFVETMGYFRAAWVVNVFQESLGQMHKTLTHQYMRDIQLHLPYDWRLIHKNLYMTLMSCAIRTAFAILSGQRDEYLPRGGIKQPLYRLWYVLGPSRLLQIARVMADHMDEIFKPVLFKVEVQQPVLFMRRRKDNEVVPEGQTDTIPFTDELADEDTAAYVARVRDDLSRQVYVGDDTLLGATLSEVDEIIHTTQDKVVLFATNEYLLSYVGIMLSLHRQILPVTLKSKKRLTEDTKPEDIALDPAVTYYAHAKSTYSNIENVLLSYFKFAPSVRILLISYNKGGVGLNLQVANRVIFLGGTLRYTEMRQARDRVYRNNQKKRVHITHMAMKMPTYPIHNLPPPEIDTSLLIDMLDPLYEYKFAPRGREDWWYLAMYHIAAKHSNLSHSLTPEALANHRKAWAATFAFTYEYVSKRRVLSAHELVTDARNRWQEAHSEFYPYHLVNNATTFGQLKRMLFARAVFAHRLSLLVDMSS
jgi:hypothetical protein